MNKTTDEITPQQLEKAARALCKMKRLNPDVMLVNSGRICQWEEYAPMLLARYQEMTALMEAMK